MASGDQQQNKQPAASGATVACTLFLSSFFLAEKLRSPKNAAPAAVDE
jgi:hypothetical protein